MKRRFKIVRIFTAVAIWMSFGITVFAGGINAYEQSVLDAAEGIFEYEGKKYVATDAAKSRIRNYLAQDDVDLTADQASEAIMQAFGNIPQGIAQGYLVLKEDQEENPGSSPSKKPDASQGGDNNSPQSGNNSSSQSGDNSSSQDGNLFEDGTGAPAQGVEIPEKIEISGNFEPQEEGIPERMTKEEEDALIAAILDREGLAAEEKSDERKDVSTSETPQKNLEEVDVGKLPMRINMAAVAVVVVIAVIVAAGIILFRHGKRIKK